MTIIFLLFCLKRVYHETLPKAGSYFSFYKNTIKAIIANIIQVIITPTERFLEPTRPAINIKILSKRKILKSHLPQRFFSERKFSELFKSLCKSFNERKIRNDDDGNTKHKRISGSHFNLDH